MEEEQTIANGPASGSVSEGQPLPKDEPQSRNEDIKEEVVTPKSEPAALETKEELSEQDAGDQDSDALREELQRSRMSFHLMILRTPSVQSMLQMSLDGSLQHTPK